MKEQIDGKLKEERSQKLIELSNQNEKEYHETYIGKKVEVLWEEEKNGYYQGHTKNYILAKIKSEEKLENKIIIARCVKGLNDHILLEVTPKIETKNSYNSLYINRRM